jgi:hypothetical protein
VTAGGLTLALTPDAHLDDTIRYSVAFPAHADAVDVTVAFVRRAGRRGAPSSTVRVPGPFELTGPTPKALARGDALTVGLSRPWDQATLAFDGPCLSPMLPFPVKADGSITFDTSSLLLVEGTYGCEVRVDVRFEARGSIDPAFERGAVGALVGAQVRSFQMELAK